MTNNRAPSKIIHRGFPGIKPNEIEELIAFSQVRAYPPGAILCRENAVEDRFYMILEGEVEVSKVINNSQNRLLKTLDAGDFFGEMALIHNAPRAATVTPKTALTTLELDKAAFNHVLRHSNSVAMAMVSEISNRLRSNDQLAVDDLPDAGGGTGGGVPEAGRAGTGAARVSHKCGARTPHPADGGDGVLLARHADHPSVL